MRKLESLNLFLLKGPVSLIYYGFADYLTIIARSSRIIIKIELNHLHECTDHLTDLQVSIFSCFRAQLASVLLCYRKEWRKNWQTTYRDFISVNHLFSIWIVMHRHRSEPTGSMLFLPARWKIWWAHTRESGLSLLQIYDVSSQLTGFFGFCNCTASIFSYFIRKFVHQVKTIQCRSITYLSLLDYGRIVSRELCLERDTIDKTEHSIQDQTQGKYEVTVVNLSSIWCRINRAILGKLSAWFDEEPRRWYLAKQAANDLSIYWHTFFSRFILGSSTIYISSRLS